MKLCDCYERVEECHGICNGTRERDTCKCKGDPTKCDFYPEKRESAIAVEKSRDNCLKIYYAHHRWKYGTEIEKYEIELIKSYFPNAWIFNPSTELDIYDKTEDEIMKECLDQVRRSDILVFSSVDGVVGIGVFKEFEEAQINHKPTFYIYGDKLWANVNIFKNNNSTSDRTYGLIGKEKE